MIKLDRRDLIVGAMCLTIAPAAKASEGQIHEVKIKKFKFSPKKLEVAVGDRIRWTNLDIAPHTATAVDESWDTGTLEKDESAEIEITSDSGSKYMCLFHPHMKASITLVSD